MFQIKIETKYPLYIEILILILIYITTYCLFSQLNEFINMDSLHNFIKNIMNYNFWTDTNLEAYDTPILEEINPKNPDPDTNIAEGTEENNRYKNVKLFLMVCVITVTFGATICLVLD